VENHNITIGSDSNWQPMTIHRIEKVTKSSMWPALVLTDDGEAYVKPMGTNRGPHPIACELVGSLLAQWFGLPVPDFCIMELDKISTEMIIDKGGKAIPGPAFASRRIHQAVPWDGSGKSLEKLEKNDIISRLVVFDTWTRNWDRCPPEGDDRRTNKDNVLLTSGNGKLRLWVVDQGECFSHGGELNEQISNIDRTKDKKVYGLFDEFKPFIRKVFLEDSIEMLRKVENSKVVIEGFIKAIPSQWQVSDKACKALNEFVSSRAAFLSDNNYIVEKLRYCGGNLL